jgi:outer membrane protein assembly factor BamE (lipoprotein component of BamABCDE complex)
MIAVSFHRDRWDYAYYFRRGRSPDAIQRWFVVYFDNDRVTRIDRNVELQPAG